MGATIQKQITSETAVFASDHHYGRRISQENATKQQGVDNVPE
jgi:hypothetical protein